MSGEISRRSFLTAVGGAVGANGVTGVTSAQSTGTATNTENDQPTYEAQVSPTVRLVSYELTRDTGDEIRADTPASESSDSEIGTSTFTLTVECDVPRLLTTTDAFAGLASEGVTEVEQERTNAPRGRTQLTRDVTTIDGEAAIGLAAPEGVVRISTGLPDSGDDGGIFDGGPTWDTVRLAAGASGAGVLGAVGTEAYRRRNGGRSEVNRKA